MHFENFENFGKGNWYVFIHIEHLYPHGSNLSVLVSKFMINFCLPHRWLPRWFSSKESACSTGDPGSVPKLGRSPGEGNGNLLQYYSCLESPMDRGAWRATVHGVTKSGT